MSDTPDPAEAIPKHGAAHATPAAPSALRSKAAARAKTMPDTVRLVCASALALALGVACGLWLFARLAAASSPTHARAHSPRAARASATSAAVPEPVSVEHKVAASSPAAEVLTASRTVAADRGAATKRAETNAKLVSKETTPKAASSVAKSAAARRESAAGPCAIYASTGALSLRGGGAATLVLGGTGGVTVTTPDWANIAVFDEGRTGAGGRAWSKYTVRSVSGRAGSYTLRLASPCGSQTVAVRVAPR